MRKLAISMNPFSFSDGGFYGAHMMQQGMQNDHMLPGELGGIGTGAGAGPGPGTGTVSGRVSGEVINPEYFGGAGIGGGGGGGGGGLGGGGGGANHGQTGGGGNHGMGGQAPNTGNGQTMGNGGNHGRGGHAPSGTGNGPHSNPAHNSPQIPSPAGGPARSSAEIRNLKPFYNELDGGIHGQTGSQGGIKGVGGMVPNSGGNFHNLLSQGDKSETGGNGSASTAAGIAAGALVVAAAIGVAAFIIIRKRKHSILINSI